MAQEGGGAQCDIETELISATADMAAEFTYSGIAGAGGSSWTLASYKGTYVPGTNPQSIVLRLTTADGSDFSDDTGRVGVGIVGETGQSSEDCGGSNGYTEVSFSSSLMAGVELDTGIPFITFSNPGSSFFSDITYDNDAIDLTVVEKISITLWEGASFVQLTIHDSTIGGSGGILFQETESWPTGFKSNWVGTDKGAMMYYGINSGSGSVLARAFVSAR